MKEAVAVVSGGMDSGTLLYKLKDEGYQVHALSFNYGQKHKKELTYAQKLCANLGFEHRIVDLGSITSLLDSSLTRDDVEVPEGHYAQENMKSTVVPNRNMIMMSISAGYAISLGAEALAVGVHGGDHFIYPDCRPSFIQEMERTLKTANEGFINPDFKVYAPFLNITKADIASLGDKLKVPYQDTWSCYKGGEYHCGKCGTCVERIEAFQLANVKDPTIYETSH